MSTEGVKKVFIDSRYRDSGSDSDFKITLPYNLNFSDNTKMYIDNIIIPNSIKTINNTNNKLYISLFYEGSTYDLILQLTNNIYNADSFITEFQTKLNTLLSPYPNISISAAYNFVNNIITLTMADNTAGNNSTFTIISKYDLEHGLSNFGTINNPLILNSIIGVSDDNNLILSEVLPFTGYMDLHNLRSIYITSSSLANYDTSSNFNMSNIIKKIPVRAGYNEIIYDNISGIFDYVGLSKSTISTVDFQLRDTKNNIIDLNNTHISFTLIFVNLE